MLTPGEEQKNNTVNSVNTHQLQHNIIVTMPKVESSKKAKLKQAVRKIPFARGYHPPTSVEQIKAIGFKQKALPIEYSDVSEEKGVFFTPVPEPTSIDDWLAQYVEDGQTFREYLKENPWFSRRKQKFMRQQFVSDGQTLCEKYPEGKIYIAKIGEFDACEISFDDLIDYIQRFLCVPVQILEGLDIEKRNNDLVFVENPAFNPSSRPGARIKKSFLHTRFDIRENKTVGAEEKRRLILHRSCKLVVHEICHLLGLPHCVYYRCCMNGSGHLQEDFEQPMMLCPVDLHKLQALIGFDVVARYRNLLEFFKLHKFTEEEEWMERRLMYLESPRENDGSTLV